MIRSLAKRALDGLRLAPLLFRKPAVLILWLLTAHAAQFALTCLLLTIPALVIPAVDSWLEEKYPATVSTTVKKRFLGIIKREVYERNEDPRLQNGKKLLRTVAWTSTAGTVGFLLLIHIPSAFLRAEARARQQEAEADSIIESQPSRSILLYRSAMKLAVDEGYSASLEEKIRSFDQKVSGSVFRASLSPGQGNASTLSDATVLLSSTEAQGSSGQSDLLAESPVGPEARYRIESTLGTGTMGVTYLAHDTVLERDVALKEILPNRAHDQKLVSRFCHEARVLAKLAHPGIIQVYDFLQEQNRFWIVMELVRGSELEDLLKERVAIPVPETARIGVLMSEAMAYAHSQGVVHRDFKPSNVMLTGEGLPKITDFGLAKIAQSGQGTQMGTVLGSPLYMSPEQAAGRESDSRSDIYSLGVVLYRMLAGKVPFAGENFASILAQHINSDPVPPRSIVPGLPEELESLILSMLAKEPDKRIQDMTSVAKVLQKYAAPQFTPGS